MLYFHSVPSCLILFNTLVITGALALTQGVPEPSNAPSHARHPRLLYSRAAVADLNKVKAGLLVKNNTQTTCALGLLDNKAALVSADCLDFHGDKVSTGTTYKVYINSGYDETSSNHEVTDISVHPNYSKETKANNVALLQFNDNSDISWYNYNAITRSTWDDLVYVQYSLSDVSQMKWNTPRLYTVANSDDTDCSDYSNVYKNNKKSFSCSSKVITDAPAGITTVCSKVPYEMVYATIGEYVYPAGMLSHVAVKDADNLCGSGGEALAYYTLFSNYLMFASVALNRTVYYYSGDNSTSPQKDPYFAMQVPAQSVSGVQVIGGDLYAKQTGVKQSESVTAQADETNTPFADSSLESNYASPTSGDSSNGSTQQQQEQQKQNSGTSKKTTIIAAACSAVGAVLLATGLFLFVKWWRKHGKIRRQRDPYKETAAQEILANGLGGASVPAVRVQTDLSGDFLFARPPPAYADSNAAMSPTSVVSPLGHEQGLRPPVLSVPPAPFDAAAPAAAAAAAAAHHEYPADEKN
ncbi:hypothetical protein J3B02_000838 [Coemansia erecta]|uniref:Peptidase S1 domain-containing protein n=1 Tax=Coemansia asiatica TaxID=1052880 RepID=A0A9W7XJI4_9FUNG|nr:hypothetical protein LPJ64_002515 [Coemansia asiatica]KAJ2857673.1 hypothetical protein J3B02_000838 [Coemansia erecta]KAJ2888284.1 hypothetical protein FB639_000741 [Coemansia asiatica]